MVKKLLISPKMWSKERVLRPEEAVKVLPCMGSQHQTTLRLALDAPDERGQTLFDPVVSETGYQSQAARFIARIERVANP
jgi:hypothetical protein